MKLPVIAISILAFISSAAAQTTQWTSTQSLTAGDLTRDIGAANPNLANQLTTAYNAITAGNVGPATYQAQWDSSGNVSQSTNAPSSTITLSRTSGYQWEVLTGSQSSTSTSATSFSINIVQVSAGIARVEVNYTITIRQWTSPQSPGPLVQQIGVITIGTIRQSSPNTMERATVPNPSNPLSLNFGNGSNGHYESIGFTMETWLPLDEYGYGMELTEISGEALVYVPGNDNPGDHDAESTTPPPDDDI